MAMMRIPATLFVRLLLVLAAFCCGLALACVPKPKPPTDGSGTPIDGGGPPATVPAEYRFPLPDDARSLDPAQLTDTVSDSICRRIFNTLVKFDPSLAVVDDLAESHSISPDGLTYSFKLRQGVRFHSGQEVKAEDVAYSLRRILDPATASPRANLLYYIKGAQAFNEGKTQPDAPVEGIQVMDDYTIQLVLTAPYAPFIDVLCMTNFGVVPRSEVEKDPAGFGDHPVGTGPFVFSSWLKKDRIELKANRDYFRTPPQIQTLLFRIINNEKTRYENFKSGTLEHCDIPPSQIAEVNADQQLKSEIVGVPAMDMYAYGFNCEQPPFKDNTALRRALNYAVDKQNIANNIWGGLVTEQKSYVPAGMFYEWKDAPGYPYDPEKAAQLLEEAGYPGGQGLPKLTLHIDLQPTNRLVAQAVQADLAKVGVQVEIQTVQWGEFLTKIYDGQSLFFQNTWLTDYPDPDNWLYVLLSSDNFGEKGNTTRWSNSEFDHLVKQAQIEVDPAVRADLYGKAEQIAWQEAPWLLLLWKNSSTLVQPYVKGLTITRMDRTPQLNNAPIDQVSLEAH
jgi:oligopeptide transport system substrate-binding protein